jgi:hypothetical protein
MGVMCECGVDAPVVLDAELVLLAAVLPRPLQYPPAIPASLVLKTYWCSNVTERGHGGFGRRRAFTCVEPDQGSVIQMICKTDGTVDWPPTPPPTSPRPTPTPQPTTRPTLEPPRPTTTTQRPVPTTQRPPTTTPPVLPPSSPPPAATGTPPPAQA